MDVLGPLVAIALVVWALRGSRWAFAAYLVFAVAFLPARAGFQLAPFTCETEVSVASALFSLRNWKHIVLSAIVAMMTVAQFRERRGVAAGTAVAVTVVLGLIAELEQGAFARGHCRIRDLVPDFAGAVLGALVFVLLSWRVDSAHAARKDQPGPV
ncbi:MAG: VanZ family protein [Vicinamibacteria bacterium]|nr:VanZ family protein [Vicinamibacteria bacterium]